MNENFIKKILGFNKMSYTMCSIIIIKGREKCFFMLRMIRMSKLSYVFLALKEGGKGSGKKRT